MSPIIAIEICSRWEQRCQKGGRWRPKKYERPSKSCRRLKLKNYKQNQTINSTSLTYISFPSVDYGALEVVIFLNSSLKSWEKDHHENTVMSLDDWESTRKRSVFFLPRFTLPMGGKKPYFHCGYLIYYLWYISVCQLVTDIQYISFPHKLMGWLQLPIPESLMMNWHVLKKRKRITLL